MKTVFAFPIWMKEVTGLNRQRSLWRVEMLWTVLLALLLLVFWPRGQRVNPFVLQASGQAFFSWVVRLEAGMVLLALPALVAGSMIAEKQGRTLEMLMLTPMRPGAIVATKCLVWLFKFGLLLILGLPILMLALFFGGASLEQFCWATLVVVVLAWLGGAAGAFTGALLDSFVGALASAYGLLAIVLLLIPLLVGRLHKPAGDIANLFKLLKSIEKGMEEIPGGTAGLAAVLGGWAVLGLLGLLAAGIFLQGSRHPAMFRSLFARRAWPARTAETLPEEPGQLMVWWETRGMRIGFLRLSTAGFLLLFLVLVTLNLVGGNRLQDPWTSLGASLMVCAGVLALTIFTSASNTVRDKQEGDLELLLLTRMKPGQLLDGKYKGIRNFMSVLLLLPLAQGLWSAEPLRDISISLVFLCAFFPAAILAGIAGGIESPDLVRALPSSVKAFGKLFWLNLGNLTFISIVVFLSGAVPILLVVWIYGPLGWLLAAAAICWLFIQYNRSELIPKTLRALGAEIQQGLPSNGLSCLTPAIQAKYRLLLTSFVWGIWLFFCYLFLEGGSKSDLFVILIFGIMGLIFVILSLFASFKKKEVPLSEGLKDLEKNK